MRVCITGICGFAGTAIARGLIAHGGFNVIGIDNLSRSGSHLNRASLLNLGIRVLHGDVRVSSDIEVLPAADWLIDAAANPSVLAGADGRTSSRQLLEHNLAGTINSLEFCKRHRAGFILLSTSRVYSIDALAMLPLEVEKNSFRLGGGNLPNGVSAAGVTEEFSTAPPLSLYGVSKQCSEALALEYAALFDFPVWIDRCGVMAGAGQFGHAEQGIFSYWVHSWAQRRRLIYIGFGGHGAQVRDALHPDDVTRLLVEQMADPDRCVERIFNLGGGAANAASLAQLSAWCERRFGLHKVASDPTGRQFDVPWLVMDSSRARAAWQWEPQNSLEQILEEIAQHAEANPDWLQRIS